MFEEADMISKSAFAYAATATAAGAAGGAARWAFDGKRGLQTFLQYIVGGVFGGAAVITASPFLPVLEQSWVVFIAAVFGFAFLIVPVIRIVFGRAETADIHLDLPGIDVDSKGKKDAL